MRALFVAAGLVVAISVAITGAAGARRAKQTPQTFSVGEGPHLGGQRSAVPLLEIHVPHRSGDLVVDGDTDDAAWFEGGARTGAFVGENGAAARPFSEARLLWGDGHLYVALYAADEDIVAQGADADGPVWLGDAFRLVFRSGDTEKSIEVSPLATLTDGMRIGSAAFDYGWQSGTHVSREIDGTVNHAGDSDEEWGIEMAIPLEALGLTGKKGERIGFSAKRCDRSSGPPTRLCGTWGAGSARGTIVLD